MSGDERYQHLADGFVSTEGKPFATPEIAEKYRQRAQRYLDVVALNEPDEVPVAFMGDGFFLENAGIKPVDVFYDQEKAVQAVLEFHEGFDPGYSVLTGPLSGKAFDTLGLKLIRWPGAANPDSLPDDISFQYVESEYMKADEYDQLIQDPEGYMVRTYVPRICSELGGLATLPSAFDLVEAGNITGTLAGLAKGTPARAAIDTLLKAADESMEAAMPYFLGHMQILSRFGAPSWVGGLSFMPYDIIGDTMRCTTGMMKDMFRHGDRILAAVDTLVPTAVQMGLHMVMVTRSPTVFFPLHKGADGFMSPAQFEKFYWPSMKATCNGLIDAGCIPLLFVEGSYDQRLDIIAADPLPKGRSAWIFDRTDMKAAKEKIGPWGCIAGNVPASLFAYGSVQDMEEYCKDLIDTCAQGGGFFLTPGVILDHAKPENVRAFLKCGEKYGKY